MPSTIATIRACRTTTNEIGGVDAEEAGPEHLLLYTQISQR
jgi:hypothetical protein